MAAEHIVTIVQARMGSTRFPGKTLAPFAGTTVLAHILGRLRRASRPLDIWVATTDRDEDDAVVQVCAQSATPASRGSADDVLSRFITCLQDMPELPSVVLRVCADRPLLCPLLVDELLEAYDELGRPDYLSNNLQPSYPDGLDLELVRTEMLLEAHRESRDAYEREHVTPFVYRRPERFRLAGLTCPFGNFSDGRAALDTPADYERLQAVHKELSARAPDYDYRDVLNLASLQPELF